MSETEEAVFVEKMAELEAEPFEKDVSDLMNFSDSQITHIEESPVSSTTDQLMDLVQPDGEESEATQGVAESSSPAAATTTPQVEEEPEQVTSSFVEPVPPVDQKEEKPLEKIPSPAKPEESHKELTSCMAKWLIENNVDKRVIDLIYWKCWKKTAAVFIGTMFILLSLNCCTLLSVVTLFSMSLLAVAFLYRIGMTVFNAVQKTSAEHPFRHILDQDMDLCEETVQKRANEARNFVNHRVKQLKKLFLIEDVVESIKFGVMLWLLSYIGSWFSMMSIVTIGCVYVFSVPVIYERHQEQVDRCLSRVISKVKEVFSKVQDKLPAKLKFGKAKEE